MSYTYGDDELKLIITSGCNGGPLIGFRFPINDSGDTGYTFQIPAEDAPAAALAILEAAGYGETDENHETSIYPDSAVTLLREHVKHCAEARAREAEDAKVREWLRDIHRITSDAYRITDYDRVEYKRNAGFFTEAA